MNSIYRIVGKYFAIEFIQFISPLISSAQHAILPQRSITRYLISIRDRFLESSSSQLSLLQMDFTKAYDIINRVVIVEILKHIKTPPHLLRYIMNILQPSTAYFALPHGFKSPITISGGVRQGCPISPFIFITVYDLFLWLMSPVQGLVCTWMTAPSFSHLKHSSLEPLKLYHYMKRLLVLSSLCLNVQ